MPDRSGAALCFDDKFVRCLTSQHEEGSPNLSAKGRPLPSLLIFFRLSDLTRDNIMHGLYCQSKASFLDLLRPLFSEFDELYWIVDCQMGPVPSNWIYENQENEKAFAELHLPVSDFENSSAHLWRPGSLSKVGHMLYFDEWSYFLGFRASEDEAAGRAGKLWGGQTFSGKFFDGLEREGELFVVHGDGRWEFYPARETLLTRIQGLVEGRLIRQSAGTKDGRPEFV